MLLGNGESEMVKIYVNEAWLAYVGSFFGASDFPPDLDANKDGVVDIIDLTYFSHLFNTWIELGTTEKPEKPTNFMDWWALRPSLLNRSAYADGSPLPFTAAKIS